MVKRRIRRKYQTGGIIPSLQGAQVLSRPLQVNPNTRPIEFNPNSAFQAIQARDRSKQTAISQANLNLNERRVAWEKEFKDRAFLQARLDGLKNEYGLALDKLTGLDMSVPEQQQLSTHLRKRMDELRNIGVGDLMDNSIPEAERMAKFHENTLNYKKLFDQEYTTHIQNNEIANRAQAHIQDAIDNDNVFVDQDAAHELLSLADDLKRGRISPRGFYSRFRKVTVDKDELEDIEEELYSWIDYALDPDKSPTVLEEYKGDSRFLTFIEKFNVPSLEDQVNSAFEYLNNNELWKKYEEKHKRRFTDENNFLDETKLKDHLRRLIKIKRGPLSDEAQSIPIGIESKASTKSSSFDGGGDGSTPNTTYGIANDAYDSLPNKEKLLVRDLYNAGYRARTPSDIKSVIDDDYTVSYITSIMEASEEELKEAAENKTEEADYLYDKSLFESIFEPIPEPEETTGNFETSNFNTIDNLQPGDNPNVVPEKLDTNLAFYTNNPLNIKGRDNVPVHKRFDNDGDGLYHRIFPTMQAGIEAGVGQINRYITPDGNDMPQNATFANRLKNQGKTLKDATLTDMYKTWATGATDSHIKTIAERAGIKPDTKLVDITNVDDLFMGILKVENGDLYKELQSGIKKPKSPTAGPSPDSIVNALEKSKKVIEGQNIFGDDLSTEIDTIDKQIDSFKDMERQISELKPKTPTVISERGFGDNGSLIVTRSSTSKPLYNVRIGPSEFTSNLNKNLASGRMKIEGGGDILTLEELKFLILERMGIDPAVLNLTLKEGQSMEEAIAEDLEENIKPLPLHSGDTSELQELTEEASNNRSILDRIQSNLK